MDLSIYFEPIQLKVYHYAAQAGRKKLGDVVRAYLAPNDFPDLEDTDLAIIGVNEDRNAVNNEGCGQSPDHIREELYELFQGSYKIKMVDLGNILQGHSVQDTFFALSAVVTELLSKNILPVILGGSQDLTYANYLAYEKLGRIINIVTVDPMFDLGQTEDDLDSRSYLNGIILKQPNYLFNFTNIGYQTYFVDQEMIGLMKNLFFDAYRLGNVRANMEESEPMVRNADLISIDISAIRMSDAPGNGNAVPNGLCGEEMCQIVRYAGLSDKLSSIGFYEYNHKLDRQHQTAQLISQMIWYFIDGFYNRKKDFPDDKMKDYIKFTVTLEDFKDKLLFYKSKRSDRWWMKVPVRIKMKSRYERHHMVPCSYADYQMACNNTIPDRWWQTYQKLM